MANVECRIKNEEAQREFAILHSTFDILHSASPHAPPTRRRHRMTSKSECRMSNVECRIKNEEEKSNLQFFIRHSTFFILLLLTRPRLAQTRSCAPRLLRCRPLTRPPTRPPHH